VHTMIVPRHNALAVAPLASDAEGAVHRERARPTTVRGV
jgi:hypothetical protein